MIIKKINLHNWKNFQNVSINLTERIFVIGPNASGKSNFLDAFRFLRDICKLGGGLQTAVSTRGGIKKIRCLSARTKSDIQIEIHLGEIDQNTQDWIYSLSFKHTGGGIMKNEVTIISEKVWSPIEKKWILKRTENDKEEDTETLKYTHLEQITQNKKFRELYGFFQQIEYLNVIPQLVRDFSSYMNTKDNEDFFGRNFLERISKMNDNTANSYFKRINEVLQLAVPQLEELKFVKDDNGIPHLEARYKHWRAKGSKQTEEQFSDGTLRLIGFLWALLDSQGTTLLEEPEINLHTEIIKQFPEFISKIQRSKKKIKQIIITTHSYDLLSHEGISPNEVILLQNTIEGTEIKSINDISEIKSIIEAGISVAEATIPFTAPKDIKNINLLKL